MRKIVVGLAAVVAVGALAACSSGSPSANNHPQLAAANATSSVTTSTIDTPPTTTTTAPTTTVAPPQKAPVQVPAKVAPVVVKAPVVPAAPPAQSPAGVPCGPTAKACVSIATRQAWLVENGHVVLGPVSIMPGRPGYRTPIGTFHVLSKAAHFWSTEFNAPMPDSVFFYPGVAFHIGSLSVLSHGCIHLSASSGAAFFNDMSIGDEVQVLQG
jgi:lipoprotein-anchoring transpeptidase ErfK/SrfK